MQTAAEVIQRLSLFERIDQVAVDNSGGDRDYHQPRKNARCRRQYRMTDASDERPSLLKLAVPVRPGIAQPALSLPYQPCMTRPPSTLRA